ncbi:MAG: WYL domain-containing protein [Betaproteobacteria bacterium]|nr:WYL domain-containing protein [Betaproteobacteria bacterium]
MPTRALDEFPQSQKDRLAFIEFRLWFLGDISRRDLMDRFGIAPAVATRDLAAYRELAPDNIDFEGSRKLYVCRESFQPLFEHQAERVLSALSKGFGDGTGERSVGYLTCELPLRLNKPSLSVLAVIARAIHQGKALQVNYHSLNKGASEREIVPFALVDSGLRWHIRAYDRKSGEFRDLVISRVENPALLADSPVEAHERSEQDDQWTRRVTLEMVPHPNQTHPEIVARDFGIGDVLTVRTRAAVAGYVLQLWNVDCSRDHCLDPTLYRLWLRDPLVLYGVSSAVLSPGFENAESPR